MHFFICDLPKIFFLHSKPQGRIPGSAPAEKTLPMRVQWYHFVGHQETITHVTLVSLILDAPIMCHNKDYFTSLLVGWTLQEK